MTLRLSNITSCLNFRSLISISYFSIATPGARKGPSSCAGLRSGGSSTSCREAGRSSVTSCGGESGGETALRCRHGRGGPAELPRKLDLAYAMSLLIRDVLDCCADLRSQNNTCPLCTGPLVFPMSCAHTRLIATMAA